MINVKVAGWRGPAKATKKPEFMRLLRYLRPTKKDIFYDLGCGHGYPCIWIAKRVKLAIGIENHYARFCRAQLNVQKSGLPNVKIIKKDLEDATYEDATIIYSFIELSFNDLARIQKFVKSGTTIVMYARVPYPIRSRWVTGNYFMMKTPFKRVRSEDEYARIYMGKKKATIDDVYAWFGRRKDAKKLKWEISRANSNWNKLMRRHG